MPRPVILGVVGDSAAGKTTITRGLVRALGEQNVTHIAADRSPPPCVARFLEEEMRWPRQHVN